jgi:hypothetical protein
MESVAFAAGFTGRRRRTRALALFSLCSPPARPRPLAGQPAWLPLAFARLVARSSAGPRADVRPCWWSFFAMRAPCRSPDWTCPDACVWAFRRFVPGRATAWTMSS